MNRKSNGNNRGPEQFCTRDIRTPGFIKVVEIARNCKLGLETGTRKTRNCLRMVFGQGKLEIWRDRYKDNSTQNLRRTLRWMKKDRKKWDTTLRRWNVFVEVEHYHLFRTCARKHKQAIKGVQKVFKRDSSQENIFPRTKLRPCETKAWKSRKIQRLCCVTLK